MTGIQQTRELIVGVNELAILIIGQVKDGLQLSDLGAVFAKWQTDTAFQAALLNAVQGIGEIPAEVKDVSIDEAIALAGVQLAYIPKIVAAAKKSA